MSTNNINVKYVTECVIVSYLLKSSKFNTVKNEIVITENTVKYLIIYIITIVIEY